MNGPSQSLGIFTLLLAWLSCLCVGVPTAAVCTGCSCRREAPRASWDAGLPLAATEAAPQEAPGSADMSGPPGNGTGRGVEAVNAGTGADGDAGDGKGDAGASGDRDTAPQGDGSDERGNAGSGTAEAPEGAGVNPGQTARATSPRSGKGNGKASGLDEDPQPEAGVFPGREPKPHLDATRAIEAAEAALAVAERERDRGRLPEAYDQARAAFEAVRPHVEADRRCHELADRALKLLRELEKRIDKRPATVRPTPTVFE